MRNMSRRNRVYNDLFSPGTIPLRKDKHMQLQQFSVKKLFGKYDHTVNFPTRAEGNREPSLVMLCGQNGIGKTTVLQMIDGFKRLDFSMFRRVPFAAAKLMFSDGSFVSVRQVKRRLSREVFPCLRVEFKKHAVDLHMSHSGPLFDKDEASVEEFRQAFFTDTTSVMVEYVSTSRLQALYQEQAARLEEKEELAKLEEEFGQDARHEFVRSRRKHGNVLLSERIGKFTKEAQLNYRRFFSSSQPDLFPKVIERLTQKCDSTYDPDDLLARMVAVKQLDDACDAYGLFKERWDITQLKPILQRKGKRALDQHALAVVTTYVEYLESRSGERKLLIDRIQTFENTVNDFLRQKIVRFHAEKGLQITTENGMDISEGQLSSGEYHLLYLLTVALTTQRRGTVIAIDEPEISMHLEWQRKLVPAILCCASMAEPQVIIATHSPDVTAEFTSACITLE